jgi:hypothetical protein
MSTMSTARGEWTFVNLRPAGVQSSLALFDAADGQVYLLKQLKGVCYGG